VPDDEWGEAVGAALVLDDGATAPSVDDLRVALRGTLPDHALPRLVTVLPALPVRGPGKPDRSAIRSRLAVEA
jgi:O-succinylbenzoic acid--CoA ligase